MTWVPIVIALAGLAYAAFLFASSRRAPEAWTTPPPGLFYVFVVPCLNEEVVIGTTIRRLLDLPGPPSAVLVVDDGSDDGTADVVRSFDPERVWLLNRELPEARRGKGAALNHAYLHLLRSDLLGGRNLEDVIVCIVDADGRLARSTLVEVAPMFNDPQLGAVQIGVRMYNAHANLLARMQDMEFVIFTEIFQRARTQTGSAGLGGNGQFARLSALTDLGVAPWTDYLTEDLDLGLRLLLEGWRTGFCPRTWVDQQAVTDMPRLLRQRTRWYQGHLQCWSRIPSLIRSRLSWRVAADLTYHLMIAVGVLLMGIYSLVIIAGIIVGSIIDPELIREYFLANHGLPLVAWYFAAFALAWFYAWLYWLATPKLSFWRILLYAHIYCAYTYIWVICGVRALWRMATKKSGWAKTSRTNDVPPAGAAPPGS
ncbi:MAG: glycosyltransferase family 2 protein [Ilumatobacteraceae bacterium]